MPRESKSEQRAQRIGPLTVEHTGEESPHVWRAWLTVCDKVFIGDGRTRAEAIRNVLRAADRLATRVERSKR